MMLAHKEAQEPPVIQFLWIMVIVFTNLKHRLFVGQKYYAFQLSSKNCNLSCNCLKTKPKLGPV